MSSNKKETVVKNSGGTTKDVLLLMKKHVQMGIKDPYLIYVAKKILSFPENEREQKIFDFAYAAATFEADPPNHQRVRTAKRVLEDQLANCVDYSVLIATLMKLCAIPFRFRLLSESESSGYIHIFVVSEKGTKLDAILGRPGSGTEQWFKESANGYFNQSVPFFYDSIDVKI